MLPEETTHVIYINEKHNLLTQKVNVIDDGSSMNYSCTIKEDNLIVGFVLNGVPQFGEQLKFHPFTPLEKHLFEANNVHFNISKNHFRIENTFLSWSVRYL